LFLPTGLSALAPEGSPASLACPPGQVITGFSFATFGTFAAGSSCAAGLVPAPAVLGPARRRQGGALPQAGGEAEVDLRIGAEGRRGRIKGGLQDGHGQGIAGGRPGG
jgi:hypothetical protein